MKKQFTLFLALVLSVGTMFAGEVLIDGLSYNLDYKNKTAEVTSYSINGVNYAHLNPTISIPEYVTYNYVPFRVTSIKNNAFTNCTSLTSVTIPNSVPSIGVGVFEGCTSLTSVTIPNSVTSIGDAAFANCSSLTSVTIPNSVTSFGQFAFGHSGLTSIEIPNSVTSIGKKLFEDCTALTSVTIPNSVTNIEVNAFLDCTGLTSVTIPNSVTSIGYGAFGRCSGLTSITIGNSVSSIGAWAFSECTSLISITIGNSVTSIGASAFAECTSLTSVTIGNSVTSIEACAFRACSGLTSVTCLANTPPKMSISEISEWGVFHGLDCKQIHLYVPAESVNVYKHAHQWSNFYPNIFPITADETTSTAVTAIPTDDNNVVLSWPSVSGADTYTIEIRKNGELICTLTFNDQGQLLTINFAMPARDGHPREMQTALQTANGWQYTVNGLEPATNYTYSVTAKQGSSILFTQSVEFHTNWLNPIDNVQSDKAQSTKVLRNGQLFIERNGHTYDAKGQEVK